MATKITSIVTGGSNNHQESANTLAALGTDFFSPGIVGAITLNTGTGGTGGFAINQESSPTMQIRISSGLCYVTGTPTSGVSTLYRVNMNTFEDETIAANASGSTKYDWVYVALDPNKLNNPAVDASDVATIVISRSTSNTVDNGVPPLYGYNLGYITVVNGASSITNANVTDNRVQTGSNSMTMGSVGPTMLSNGAIALGYSQITSSFTTTTVGANVDVPGLSVAVTIPTGGRRIKISYASQYMSASAAAGTNMSVAIYDVTAAAQIGGSLISTYGASYGANLDCFVTHVPAPGPRTYKIQVLQSNAGTLTVAAFTTNPAFILVEAI